MGHPMVYGAYTLSVTQWCTARMHTPSPRVDTYSTVVYVAYPMGHPIWCTAHTPSRRVRRTHGIKLVITHLSESRVSIYINEVGGVIIIITCVRLRE